MAIRPLFSQIFAQSPIAPIQQHMKVACDTAVKLPGFFEAVLDDNWELAHSIGDEVSRLEGVADDIKRKIRSNLPRSLFMPVSRSDLLDLLKSQDRIPNRAKDIVGMCRGRHMGFPGELGKAMLSFVESSVSAASIAMETLDELNQLFETGFSGREIDLIADLLSKLNAAEHEADEMQQKVQSVLYKMESEINPVDVIFLYRVIDWVGDIADNAQAVGNRMLNLIAK